MTSSFAGMDHAQSSRILASAVEQAAESIVITTADVGAVGPQVLFVNAAFCRLTLYTSSDVVGRELDLLQGPRSNDGIVRELRERISRGLPFTSESIAYRKDGTQFLAEWDLAPVCNEIGQATQFVAILRDLTALRRVQAELLEAKALAEAADHGKSAFLASMSHELRTPLNAIIGFSELLDERAAGPLNERQGKYVTNVLTAGRSLLDLIDQVLDLTRADVGQMVLHLTKFSLQDAVHDVQPLVRALAERKHLRLRVDMPESLPLIRADARKLKQIIYSLLTSAIRTASAAGDLEVSARHDASGSLESDWFEITVSRSTGDAGDDARARQDFNAAGEAHGLSPDAGLGLALTRRLVELHGGRVLLDARPGGGLAFRLMLPNDPNRLASRPVQPPDSSDQASGPLVLVVEDNPEASDLLTHYLSTAGYAVARAFTGAEAVRLARELQPAAITMDSELPDTNGLEVVEALRGAVETKTIPVVVVSVVDRRGRASPGAVSAWLVKPVDRRELVEVIRDVIKERKS